MLRTYTELCQLETYLDRFNYLKMGGVVGQDTFAFDRYLNQTFYRSYEWKKLRREIILRDNGCDLGVEGYEIFGRVLIHHMNPISVEDLVKRTDILLDPKYLICVSHRTHNAIHYGDEEQVKSQTIVERKPGDTCPWKKVY